jgi:hypothetical protein
MAEALRSKPGTYRVAEEYATSVAEEYATSPACFREEL